LTQHIRDTGGDATLVRVKEIEGLSNERLIGLFNTARAKEYASVREMLRPLLGRARQTANLQGRLDRIRKQFREIRETDFFDSPKARDVEMVLRKLEEKQPMAKKQLELERRNFRNKIWLTRPRPEIDRVGSAWLIRKFIDPKAKFAFGNKRGENRRVITFDMLDGDFSHDGDDCTFETLIRRFRVQDKTARKIAEMVHDADLSDDKFQRAECIGIDRVLKGWGREDVSDHEILKRGFQCFDALYVFLQR
jgi:hypothetical protein